MNPDLGHWGQIPKTRLPPRSIRNQLDIIGLAMGWGNGLGVVERYLTGGAASKIPERIPGLVTPMLAKSALSWGLEELARKEKGGG